MGRPRRDITGERFGHLEGVRFDHIVNNHRSYWVVLCHRCGNLKVMALRTITHGTGTSCGCHQGKGNKADRRVHGDSGDANGRVRVYTIWKAMRQRCYNPNADNYDYYGGRGITICPEWETYPPFKAWALANGYADDLTIDREDNDGNYEPGNCRWVTMAVQTANRRNSQQAPAGA